MAKEFNPYSKEAAAHRLTITRMALGLSQAQLCRELDISPASKWNNAETGDNWLSWPNAIKFCARYGFGMHWLAQGDIRGVPEDLRPKIAEAERKLAGPPIKKASGRSRTR